MAPLEIRTFPGAGGGMDQAAPVHMLPDSKARWIIDGLVDRPGIVHQRGKLRGTEINNNPPWGLANVWTPDNQLRLAAHFSDSSTSNGFTFLDHNNAVLGTYAYTFNYTNSGFPSIWNANPALKGPGMLMSWATWLSGESTGSARGMGYWRGGSKADYTTGTITCVRGSASVTGAGTTWSSNVVPGMFVFRDNGGGTFRYLGVVKTVNSNTSITLEAISPMDAPAASNYKITSIRGLSPRHIVGRISGNSGQNIVNGTGTKFRQITAGNVYSLYRLRDGLYLGDINTINSDTQLVLNQNIPAGGEVANDKYVAIKIDDGFAVMNPNLPTITATWKGRQFYANKAGDQDGQTRIWYSDIGDFEGLDMSTDGWNLDVPSTGSHPTPILALLPAKDFLLIFKEQEVFILKGSVDPASWSIEILTEHGTLCPMSVINYNDGAIWASDEGIFYYDGQSLKNIVEDSLGDFWIKGVKGFDPYSKRMWAMIERNHYLLHVQDSFTIPQGAGYYKGSTEFRPSTLTFCINLRTEALVILTNIEIRGSSFISPRDALEGTTRYLVQHGATTRSRICKAIDLFYDEGQSPSVGGGDDFASVYSSIGPDFYIESARYDMDDPQIRKLWKQVQIHYMSSGNPLHLDTVLNFDSVGTTNASAFQTSSAFINKRFKFLKRGQLMAFRLYTKAAGGGTAATEVHLGPWAVGFKRQRPGRV